MPTHPTPRKPVIVIGHTRELAFQISKEYARFGKYLPQGASLSPPDDDDEDDDLCGDCGGTCLRLCLPGSLSPPVYM